jgi:orotate phosphoribosyltransferase
VKSCGGVVTGFASILNRSGKANPFDAPYESLLALNLDTYEESACPLCVKGVPIDAPGSRYSK